MSFTEKEQKLNSLAREILSLARGTLLVNLRFLDAALSNLTWYQLPLGSLVTDGQLLCYNPQYIVSRYKQAKELPVRDYLHVVLHCVFRHMYVGPAVHTAYWDLAADIAVENIISEMGLACVTAPHEAQQAKYIQAIKEDLQLLTAEKIYAYLKEHYPEAKSLLPMQKAFFADDHFVWYMTEDAAKKALGIADNSSAGDSADGQGSQDSQNGQGSGQASQDSADGQDGAGSGTEGAGDLQTQLLSRSEMQQIWADVSERMQVDVETFGKQRGFDAGSMFQNLKAVNREKYDYTAFLKKFAVLGEAMKINDDEFDYIFYTYGLQLYKKMPLIEPLEYKEVKRIKEFVIAIDTSGSTSGDLVQTFLQKTYNILKSTESFFSKINLHIIQCDASIQEDAKITSQEEFDKYLKTMKIRGLGGTDFRPVFHYVGRLLHDKEFTNLKGLIYFTDGFGKYPQKKPPYDTAFVFVDDNYNNPDVPPWAIKLVLQRDEI